jgi:two-component system C4-dicarboxylate transport sensor histidine kinase DctB
LNIQKPRTDTTRHNQPQPDQDASELARPQRKRVTVILIVVTIAMIVSLFFAATSYFRSEETTEAANRLSLYTRSLNDTLERFQYLPYVLSKDPLVVSGVSTGRDGVIPFELNNRLAEFANVSNLEAIYLMNLSGSVIASSNHNLPQSFMGQNYAFRPYFQNALSGNRGEFFGVGATTGRPGYFVSEPVFENSKIIGVIAIKIDMSELQSLWEKGGENVFVSNGDGIVVLSSNPSWLYRTLQALSSDEIAAIAINRQFIGKELISLDWANQGDDVAKLDGGNFVYAKEPINRLDWTVHYLLSETRVYERTLLTTVIFGSVLAVFLVFATFMRSVRIRSALSISQSDRAQLLKTNYELKTAQEQLSRTSKLAALGQLSASVTHELGQPISALRNHLTAAEISGELKPGHTLEKFTRVIDRMDNITKQLRFFTRPISTVGHEDKQQNIDIQEVIKGALDLVEHTLQSAGVKAVFNTQSRLIYTLGNRLRLEQVIVNLLTNSITAMEDRTAKKLEISLQTHEKIVNIVVRDNGTGFGDRDIAKLQEPFHTTRASGDGMGLGLSIATEIIREHKGMITAQNLEHGGAEFIISLPLLKLKDADKVNHE